MDVKKIIGENAKLARESSGFSQMNVAEFLKVDQSLVSKFEKGERTLQSGALEQLANLYGYKATDFARDNGIPEQRTRVAFRSRGITVDDMEAIHDIRRIAMNLSSMADLAGGDRGEE